MYWLPFNSWSFKMMPKPISLLPCSLRKNSLLGSSLVPHYIIPRRTLRWAQTLSSAITTFPWRKDTLSSKKVNQDPALTRKGVWVCVSVWVCVCVCVCVFSPFLQPEVLGEEGWEAMARVFGILVCAGDLHFGRKTCIRGSVSSEMEGLGEVWIN